MSETRPWNTPNFILIFHYLLTLCHGLGPPKLEEQPPEEVWFQANTISSPNNKFSLKCSASGDPEIFEWRKNDGLFEPDGKRVVWQKPSMSGTILFLDPEPQDQGYYQCFISNIFGTAVSTRVNVRQGVLDHFPPKKLRVINVDEGDSLTVTCDPPYGMPKPTIFWLYRNKNEMLVFESIKREHIAVDPDGRLHFATISMFDGRENLIYECAATSPAIEGEYRAGDHVQIVVEPVTRIIGIAAHKLYVSPEEVTVRAGTRLKLMCIFGGKPIPTIKWSKVDGELPKKRIRDLSGPDSDFGKALIIDNVHPEDSGVYECQTQHLSHKMHVSVTAAPYWDFEPPKNIEQPEESTAELHCLASGEPPPLIRWFMNGLLISEVAETNRRITLDGGRILRITDLNHDIDTGVYQCNASNPLGYVFANAFVNVKAHAPRFKMPDKRVWKVVRKSTVDLSCDVEAAPDPVVRWVDANDRAINLVPGKIHLFANHTLRILDVNDEDEDFYYCNVSNKYGINRAYNKLEVFMPSPKRLVVEAYDTVELKCEAISDPRLTIEYLWTHNGKALNSTFSTIDKDGVGVLRLEKVRGRQSGAIDCAAVTDVDVKVAGVDILVKDVPESPNISKVDCKNLRAVIRWQKPDEHGSHLSHFTIEQHIGFYPGKWKTVVEEHNVQHDNYEAVIELSPWVNYTFRVIAHNLYGSSEPGIPMGGGICSTRMSAPYFNPTNVRAMGTEPDNLVIYWTPMEKIEWNGPEMKYMIKYRLNREGEMWRQFLVEDPLANHTIIREQPTFQEYQVQVRAMNIEGPALIDPETVIGYSGEDVPEIPPADFHISDLHNYSSVKVSWNPVNPKTVRGHFNGYKIVYWLRDKPYFTEVVHVDPGSTTHIITGLEAIQNYTVVVHTINSGYESTPSEPVDFTTPEGAPSKVHNLRVIPVGAFTILVFWEPPLRPNGILRGYFITFENSTSKEIEETYVYHRQQHYMNELLTPNSPYTVSVWAETNGGEGPKVTRHVKTYPLRPPNAPNFTAQSKSPSGVVVSWQPGNSSDWKMSGASFYVNYSKTDSNIWKTSEIIYLPHTNISISDLNEDTEYELIGVAKERDLHTSSSSLFIYTLSREKELMSHIDQQSLQNSAWFIVVLLVLALALITVLCMCCCAQKKSGKYPVKQKEMEHGMYAAEDEDEHKKFLEYQYGFKEIPTSD